MQKLKRLLWTDYNAKKFSVKFTYDCFFLFHHCFRVADFNQKKYFQLSQWLHTWTFRFLLLSVSQAIPLLKNKNQPYRPIMTVVYLTFLCFSVFFTIKMRYWENGTWNNKTIQDNPLRREFFGQLVQWYSLHYIPIFVIASLDWVWSDPKCVAVSLWHHSSRACLDVKESKVEG